MISKNSTNYALYIVTTLRIYSLSRTNHDPLGDDSTPLHWACEKGKDDIALFLIEEERERARETKTEPEREEESQPSPSYNMRAINGLNPVFRTSSERIVQEMLHFEDLQVTTEDGLPLLWHCAYLGCVTETIALDVKLKSQHGQRWEGTLPLEIGERDGGTDRFF